MAGGDTDLKVLLSRDLSNAVLSLFPLSKQRLVGKNVPLSMFLQNSINMHTSHCSLQLKCRKYIVVKLLFKLYLQLLLVSQTHCICSISGVVQDSVHPKGLTSLAGITFKLENHTHKKIAL